jgi:FkbM family methyltransferase
MLRKNVAGYPNITPFRGALWTESARLDVVDPGFGSWGFRVDAGEGDCNKSATTGQSVDGISVEMIPEKFGIPRIDILKIDIEGGEFALLENCSGWMPQMDALIFELHERFNQGCELRFQEATRDHDFVWTQGELTFAVRKGGCIKAPEDIAPSRPGTSAI